MKLHLESTDQVVTLVRAAAEIRARVWQGQTDTGIPVQVLILSVAVEESADQRDFERELKVAHRPMVEPKAFPLRMVM